MKRASASEFRHTSAPTCPDHKTAIVFLNEGPGFVGVYIMDDKFRLWPARTVNLAGDQDHVETVLGAWASNGVPTIDARTLDGTFRHELRDLYKAATLNGLQKQYQTNMKSKMDGEINHATWIEEIDRIAEKAYERVEFMSLTGKEKSDFLIGVIEHPCHKN